MCWLNICVERLETVPPWLLCEIALGGIVFGDMADSGLGCAIVLRASDSAFSLAFLAATSRRAGLRSGMGGGGVLGTGGMRGDKGGLGCGVGGRENGTSIRCLEATRMGGA
jgi:hypothetical protein